MNDMTMSSNHTRTSWLRSTLVALVGLGLGVALWTATIPMTMAQGNSPVRQVESNLPSGQSVANASKADLLSAICAAVKKNPKLRRKLHAQSQKRGLTSVATSCGRFSVALETVTAICSATSINRSPPRCRISRVA